MPKLDIDALGWCTVVRMPHWSLDARIAPRVLVDLHRHLPIQGTVVVDLSHVVGMDHAGLAVLYDGFRLQAEAGGEYLVCCPHPASRRVMEAFGMRHPFRVITSRRDALAAALRAH